MGVQSAYMINDNISIEGLIKCQTSCLAAYATGDLLFFIAIRVFFKELFFSGMSRPAQRRSQTSYSVAGYFFSGVKAAGSPRLLLTSI